MAGSVRPTLSTAKRSGFQVFRSTFSVAVGSFSDPSLSLLLLLAFNAEKDLLGSVLLLLVLLVARRLLFDDSCAANSSDSALVPAPITKRIANAEAQTIRTGLHRRFK